MIEYDYLCETITAWKEGRRPAAPPPAPGAADGGVQDLDEQSYVSAEAVAPYAEPEPGYAEVAPTYTDAPEAYADAAPQPVAASGTEPIDAEDLAAASQTPPQWEDPSQPATSDAHAEQAPPAYAEGEPTTAKSAAYQDPAAALVADADLDVEEVDIDADEGEDEDEDDFERDYDLEEIDDMAGFDFSADLAGYFQAEMAIEAAWEDQATRIATLNGYGVRDEKHYYQVKATLERYVQTPDAEARYGGLDAIMQLQLNARTDQSMGVMQARAEGELAGELEPVEGISLQQWAHAQAAVAGGADPDPLIAQLGIDRPHWDRVSAEWNARMSRDTTATIATEYGKAFSTAGQGQFAGAAADATGAMAPGGDVGDTPPVSMDRYVQIMVAQSAGAEQGRDAADILAQFGINAMEWGQIGAWWGAKIARHGMENGQALLNEFNALQTAYEAQYGAGDADEDVEF